MKKAPEFTLEMFKKLYKKCKALAVPKTKDGKYYIFDKKAREEYDKTH